MSGLGLGFLDVFYSFRSGTTRPVNFSEVFGSAVPDEARKLCAEATAARESFREALEADKDGSHVSSYAQAYLKQVQTILVSMSNVKGKYDINMPKRLELSWTSSLLPTRQHFIFSVLIFDCIETLVQTGIALSNSGCDLMKASKLKECAGAFRAAAGVFDHTQSSKISEWTNLSSRQGCAVPPECRASICLMLKEMTMAQVQQVSISTAVKSKKALKVLPKLLFGCANRMDRSLNHLKSATAEFGVQVDSSIVSHLVAMSALMRATGHAKLGQMSWDEYKYGEGLLRVESAANLLEKVNRDSRVDKGSDLGQALGRMLLTLRAKHKKWNDENNEIYFDPPPDRLTDVPGKEMFAPSAFEMPDVKAVSFKPVEPPVAPPSPEVASATTATTTEDATKAADENNAPSMSETVHHGDDDKGSKPGDSRTKNKRGSWFGSLWGGIGGGGGGDGVGATETSTASPDDGTPGSKVPSVSGDEIADTRYDDDSLRVRSGREDDLGRSLNWQFEESKGKWQHYIAADAHVLDMCYRNKQRTAVIQNRWGTYDITLPGSDGFGVQKNRRTGAIRRIRCFGKKCLDFSSAPAPAPTDDDATVVIQVTIPRDSFAGQTLRIMHGGKAFDARVPAEAIRRSLKTFPVRLPRLPATDGTGRGGRVASNSPRSESRGKDSLVALIGMGFDRASAERALDSANGDVQRAAAMLASASI